MKGISLQNIDHRELDLRASVNLMGYEGSERSSGTVTIYIKDQTIHSEPLTIEGSNSEEVVKEVLAGVLRTFRGSKKFEEYSEYFKSVAQEFYPIFAENDPFAVLENFKPGFASIADVKEWAAKEFSPGTPYLIINEYGLAHEWTRVEPLNQK